MGKDKQRNRDGQGIDRDDIDDVVAIAAQLQAEARQKAEDKLQADELDTIAETVGLTREQLAQAQKIHQSREQDRKRQRQFALTGGAVALAIVTVASSGLWWKHVFPPDTQALAIESMQLTKQAIDLREQTRYAASREAAEKAVKKDPTNFRAWNMVGRGYQGLDDVKAEKAYREGIRLAGIQPDAVYLYHNLGTMLDELPSRREEAIGYFKQALQCNPAYDPAYHNMGYTYDKMGKYDLAIEAYQSALKYNPDDKLTQKSLATLMKKTGKTPAAPTGAPASGLGARLKAVELRDAIIKLYDKDKRPKEAIAYGLRAVAESDDVQVWNALGCAYEADGQKVEAARCFTKAAELGGKDAMAGYPLYNLGRLASESGDHAEGVRYLQKAVAVNPTHAWSHCYLGKELEQLGRRAEAIAAYKAALKIDGAIADATQGLQRLGGR